MVMEPGDGTRQSVTKALRLKRFPSIQSTSTRKGPRPVEHPGFVVALVEYLGLRGEARGPWAA